MRLREALDGVPDHRATAGQAPGFPMGKTPCVATLHRVFKDLEKDLDLVAFEEVLREWVKDSGVDLGSVVPAFAAGSGAGPPGDTRLGPAVGEPAGLHPGL